MSDKDDIIFTKNSGKDFTFQDLMKDIYQNTTKRRQNINEIIENIASQLSKNPETAALIAGVIPMYLNASIKNEEQLTKMAAIIQRTMLKTSSDDNGGNSLSDEEKAEILMNFKQNKSNGSNE